MPQYHYILKDSVGRKQVGQIFAMNKTAALEKLKEMKQETQYIIGVNELPQKKTWFFNKPKLNLKEKIILFGSISTMLNVGIVLPEALEIIVEQTAKPNARKIYEDLLNMVRSGQSFSKSLAKYGNVFSEIVVNMIAAGEENGNLDEVLEYISTQLEKDYETQRKVVAALVYPAVILSVTLAMALGIVIFIMPKITRIFSTFKVALPLPTVLLIGFSDLLTKQTVWVLLTVVLMVSFTVFALKFKPFKPALHRLYLKIPVIGNILISTSVARFARTLNSLLKSGTPISRSMEILQKIFTNVVYKNALKHTADIIEKGGKIGESLQMYPKLFPMLVTKMIYIGEKTGSLVTTTNHIAEMYERDVDMKTKNISTMLEPILLVFMGVLVGGIAISIILPIYQLPNMISR